MSQLLHFFAAVRICLFTCHRWSSPVAAISEEDRPGGWGPCHYTIRC